ncbi:TonB-dependent receptor, partial [bacterium]|nr:TonB-dependent receptor [bacterium]
MKQIILTYLFPLWISLLFCIPYIYAVPDTLYSSITIPTEELKLRNYDSLEDILSYLPGMWIRNSGTVGQWSSSRIRGSNENQVALLLDGNLLSDVWSGNNDLNIIPIEMIEKIEIYPTLNPFGTSSIGGAINLVSKSNPSNQPYTKIVYRTGNNHFSDLDITFSQRFSQKLEITSGVFQKKYGEFLPHQKYLDQKIRSKIYYTFSPIWKLQYTILNNKSDLDLPYQNVIPGDTLLLESPHRKRIRFDHTLQTSFDLSRTHIQLRLEHTSLRYELRENFNPQKTFPIQTTGFYVSQEFAFLNLPLSWSIYTQRRELKNNQDQKWNDTIAHSTIQGAIHFTSDLIVLIQIHSHISPDKKNRLFLANQLSWRLSNAFTIYTGYIEGVRDPSMGERFGFPFYPDIPVTENQLMMRNGSAHVLPNLSLKPEISQTVEAGFHWKVENRLAASCKGYLRSSKDLIQGITVDNKYRFENLSKSFFKGIEIQLDMGPFHGFQANLILNVLNATDANGENLLERPNMWGNSMISWNRNFFQND